MKLVTWVMEELKSKQETVRHAKTSNSRKQPTTPRLKGPKGGGGRGRALGSRPPRGTTARRPTEGRGTLVSPAS